MSIEQELYVQMDGQSRKPGRQMRLPSRKAVAIGLGVMALIGISIIIREPAGLELLFNGRSRHDDDDHRGGGPPPNAAYA